jgi:hypothetical protein
MVRTSLSGLVAAFATFLVAPTLHAQFRSLNVGTPVTGVLASTDPVLSRLGSFHAYEFEAREGRALLINLASDQFDTRLSVGRLVGGIYEELKFDDDSGGGTNSLMRFTPPATGTYIVLAHSYSKEERGSYELSVDLAPPPSTGGIRPIIPGASISGEIAHTDEVREDDAYFDAYRISLKKGQAIRIAMNSPTLDTYLRIGRGNLASFEELASDDDSGGEANALLDFIAPSSGDYLIQATTFSGVSTGTYTLTVDEHTLADAPPAVPLVPGQIVSRILEVSRAMSTEGHFHNDFTFQAEAGQTLDVRLRSEAFDTHLWIGRMVDGEFVPLDSNDDEEDGNPNSRIQFPVMQSGEYVIRASSFAPSKTGAYTLQLEVR